MEKENSTKQLVDLNYLKSTESFLKVLEREKNLNGLILSGSPGFGKTTMFRNKDKFKLLTGYSTTLSLYKALYQYRENYVVLDDIDSILLNKNTKSILKNAMDSRKNRELQYNSTSNKLDHVPPSYKFTGKIIVLTNIAKNRFMKDVDLRAISDRSLHVDIDLTMEERKAIIRKVLINKDFKISLEDKEKILNVVDQMINKNNYLVLSIRLLEKLVAVYRLDKDEKNFVTLCKKLIPQVSND